VSSLNNRRESPRRPIRSGGMHPGWECAMSAFGAGLFALPAGMAFAFWLGGRPTGSMALGVGGLACLLFWRAGRLAETLHLSKDGANHG
jgi:hypothetical protein